jgi:hypothetical protein
VRLAAALGALAVGSAGVTVTTLPRPAFPAPAESVPRVHRLVLVSSRYQAPGSVPAPRELRGAPATFRGLPLAGGSDQVATTLAFYGRDASTARIVVAVDPGTTEPRYAFDFKNVVWPPRIRPGEREFVYEQVVWLTRRAGRSTSRTLTRPMPARPTAAMRTSPRST